LKNYIPAHRYDACDHDAALGCHHHKIKATTKAKRKTESTSKTVERQWCTCLVHACACSVFARVCHACFPCILLLSAGCCGVIFHWREYSKEHLCTDKSNQQWWQLKWCHFPGDHTPNTLFVRVLFLCTCTMLCFTSAYCILSYFHNMTGIHTYTHALIHTDTDTNTKRHSQRHAQRHVTHT
jgi:hypothetical protein